MSEPSFFRNWMVAVAEAAAVAGAPDLDTATADQMTRAWGLVRKAADISLAHLAGNVAREARIRVAKLDEADPLAANLVPSGVARRRNMLPLYCTDREIGIATANPLGQGARREIAGLTSRTVRFEVGAPSDIASAIDAVYGPAADSTTPPGKQPETKQPEGPHVLVVDDEAGQRALFRSILEEGGYRVSLAADGAEAIRLIKTDGDHDLVMLDYWMDKMNGLRVLQHLRAAPATSDLPVIMVTASNDRRIEMSLFEAGADDYIAKPVDAPLFLLRVQAVLRRRQFS